MSASLPNDGSNEPCGDDSKTTSIAEGDGTLDALDAGDPEHEVPSEAAHHCASTIQCQSSSYLQIH